MPPREYRDDRRIKSLFVSLYNRAKVLTKAARLLYGLIEVQWSTFCLLSAERFRRADDRLFFSRARH
jgi:hypothetical protein